MKASQQTIVIEGYAKQRLEAWLQGPYSQETKRQIRWLLDNDPQEANDAFSSHLSFGTGGMRGLMGPGTNRFNVYTVQMATQGLANYLNKQPMPHPERYESHVVLIGYDSRHNSRLFAEEAAKVLAANHIEVYLCKELRPTPYVSFGCRHLGCSAAIMITASHNPPQYNGYKVYWSDGAQVLAPHDMAIVAEVSAIETIEAVNVLANLQDERIKEIAEDLDAAYLQAAYTQLMKIKTGCQLDEKDLRIVYTPLHGTGITLVPKLLKKCGFSHVNFVESQKEPDGSFATVKSPNPEDPAALALGMQTLISSKADLLLATDPDADRVGVALTHKGKISLLNGNQVACLCLWHICKTLSKQNNLPLQAAFIKTLPTTELFKIIAESYQRSCFDVLTGFKYIASLIREWEEERCGETHHCYLFGGEESYGYLFGDYARDKDAVEASALIAEVASEAKRKGMTLIDELHAMWRRFGLWHEEVLSFEFRDTIQERKRIALQLNALREAPPTSLRGKNLVVIEDYLKREAIDLRTHEVKRLSLPRSDVLLWWLEGGDKVIVRPSGTEPKLKIYASWHCDVEGEVEPLYEKAKEEVHALLKEVAALFNP